MTASCLPPSQKNWAQRLVSGYGSKPKAKASAQPVNDCAEVIFWTNDVAGPVKSSAAFCVLMSTLHRLRLGRAHLAAHTCRGRGCRPTFFGVPEGACGALRGPLHEQIGLLAVLRPRERVLVLLHMLGGEQRVELARNAIEVVD
jgi:hypothetical protein